MMLKLLCFKDVDNLIICFLFCLLFCRLLWNGFSELVSMMERDPNCSMDNLYE
jgi:hypothetical protein